MKLRIKGNSLRLRLSKTEVELLATHQLVEEETLIGNAVFTYQLKTGTSGHLHADLNNNQLTIYIPDSFAAAWPGNAVVGLDNKTGNDAVPALYILVEKDFKCIDNTTEDQSDNYEHPKTC